MASYAVTNAPRSFETRLVDARECVRKACEECAAAGGSDTAVIDKANQILDEALSDSTFLDERVDLLNIRDLRRAIDEGAELDTDRYADAILLHQGKDVTAGEVKQLARFQGLVDNPLHDEKGVPANKDPAARSIVSTMPIMDAEKMCVDYLIVVYSEDGVRGYYVGHAAGKSGAFIGRMRGHRNDAYKVANSQTRRYNGKLLDPKFWTARTVVIAVRLITLPDDVVEGVQKADTINKGKQRAVEEKDHVGTSRDISPVSDDAGAEPIRRSGCLPMSPIKSPFKKKAKLVAYPADVIEVGPMYNVMRVHHCIQPQASARARLFESFFVFMFYARASSLGLNQSEPMTEGIHHTLSTSSELQSERGQQSQAVRVQRCTTSNISPSPEKEGSREEDTIRAAHL